MEVFRKLETQTGNGSPSLLKVILYAWMNIDRQILSDSSDMLPTKCVVTKSSHLIMEHYVGVLELRCGRATDLHAGA
jgi:hypothetical protein